MAILIEGMEMPKRGMVVNIYADGRVTNHFDEFCKTIGKAVPVPEPHGPLYDLYDIFDNMQHSRGIDINCSSPGMTADLFQVYAPVIPASKED